VAEFIGSSQLVIAVFYKLIYMYSFEDCTNAPTNVFRLSDFRRP